MVSRYITEYVFIQRLGTDVSQGGGGGREVRRREERRGEEHEEG